MAAGSVQKCSFFQPLGSIEVGSCSHHQRTALENLLNNSCLARFWCDPERKTNCTKEENELWCDSAETNEAGVKALPVKIEDILETDVELHYNVFFEVFFFLFQTNPQYLLMNICTCGSSALCFMLIFCGCCEVKPQYSENVGTNFNFTLIVVVFIAPNRTWSLACLALDEDSALSRHTPPAITVWGWGVLGWACGNSYL